VILVGLGKKAEYSQETLRRAAAKALRAAESVGLTKIAVRAPQISKSVPNIRRWPKGCVWPPYRFDKHKTPGPDTPKPVEEWSSGTEPLSCH